MISYFYLLTIIPPSLTMSALVSHAWRAFFPLCISVKYYFVYNCYICIHLIMVALLCRCSFHIKYIWSTCINYCDDRLPWFPFDIYFWQSMWVCLYSWDQYSQILQLYNLSFLIKYHQCCYIDIAQMTTSIIHFVVFNLLSPVIAQSYIDQYCIYTLGLF